MILWRCFNEDSSLQSSRSETLLVLEILCSKIPCISDAMITSLMHDIASKVLYVEGVVSLPVYYVVAIARTIGHKCSTFVLTDMKARHRQLDRQQTDSKTDSLDECQTEPKYQIAVEAIYLGLETRPGGPLTYPARTVIRFKISEPPP